MAEYVLQMTGDAVNAALTKAQTDVSFSQAQSLTDIEKTTARNNIGAGSITDIDNLNANINNLQTDSGHKLDYTQTQTLTDTEKSQTRQNIGLNPVEFNETMIMPVGIDENGQLWAQSLEVPDITNWRQVAQIIRTGAAPSFFEVGDQFIVNKATSVTTSVSGNISGATVNLSTFINKMNEAKATSYVFSFIDSQWFYDGNAVILGDYGINAAGLPTNHDTIIVTETVEAITFDVLDFDYDTPISEGINHTMSLVAHNIYSYNEIPFDPREAFYYCSNGLSAGTYYFNMGGQPWFAGDAGKNMQFTLTKNIPAGGQLVMNQIYNATLIGSTISSFSSSIEPVELEIVTVSEGNTGTNLGTIANDVNGNFNAYDRAVLGSNNWEQSSIRRYLNSDAAGAPSNAIASWYGAPTTNWDRPVFSTKPGFLYGLDPSFVKSLQTVKKRTALNTISDNGGYKDSNEKVFYLSMKECNLNANNSVNETSFGTDKTFSTIKTTPYALYTGAVNADRVKYQNEKAYIWWLRSPNTGYTHEVRGISASGSSTRSRAFNEFGVVPALCIG